MAVSRPVHADRAARIPKNEPESLPRETSQVLAKVFAALRSEGVGKSDIATELFVSEEELNEMVFGLVLNTVKNEPKSQNGLPPVRGTGTLHLVQSD